MKRLIIALQKTQLTTKFVVGFGAVLAVTLGIGVYSLANLMAVGNEAKQIYEKDLDGIAHIKEANINLVYTINEPAAAGAYEALKSFGKENDVLIVSVDGGCPGVQNIRDGVIGATAQQYPLLMASMGIEAIAAFAADGTKPTTSEGLDFTNTGVNLVTGEAVEGVESIDIEEGLARCWG